MSARAQILERLTRSKNLAVEGLVGSALMRATDKHRGSLSEKELATVLFARESRAGRVALVKAFDRLGDDVRATLLHDSRELFGALSEAMQDPDGSARLNVIEIVRQSANPRLSYLLAEALTDSRIQVRQRAGAALLAAVRKFRDREENAVLEGSQEANDAAQIRKALEHALKQFRTHREHSVILAALVFERQPDSALWSFFSDPHDERSKAISNILRTPPPPSATAGPAVVTGILIALGTSLKPAAIAGIAATEDPTTAAAFMRESYRLADPVLHAALQQVGHLRMLETLWQHAPPNDRTWSHWLRTIDALGLQAADRVKWLGRLLIRAANIGGTPMPRGCAVWKLSVMRSLAETGTPEAGPLIAKMMEDADERVARVAARHLIARQHPEWHALATSTRCPHPSVRRLVSYLRADRISELISVVSNATPKFAPVWGEYSRMPPVVQGTTTRASAQADPDFPTLLKKKLASDQTAEVGQGLKMLSALSDISGYRSQIISLCGHPDARVVALAVKLVARLDDPKLRIFLEVAAQHADPRVRTNAIESMISLRVAQSSQHVLSMLNSRHNRERASAIKAISEFDFVTARECLTRMLADPNPLHRMSALWVVEQLGLSALFRQVATMGRRDGNLRVRGRAAELIDHFDNADLNGEKP
ncbi:MAG: HEAT repeat domain-containing protein [Phycisphaerales bacterium]|nr:HEAT repeat domain-containing protein [Phycisphaerales bacterium]